MDQLKLAESDICTTALAAAALASSPVRNGDTAWFTGSCCATIGMVGPHRHIVSYKVLSTPREISSSGADKKIVFCMNRVSILTVSLCLAWAPLHTMAQTPASVRAAAASTPSTRATTKIVPGARGDASISIAGSALDASDRPLAEAKVRLRDARFGRVVETIVTDKSGQFSFHSVEPGSYLVELLGTDQTVVAASEMLSVNAGDAVSAIIRMPFNTRQFAGVLGHTAMSALVVTAAAAASGVLATEIAGEPKSPRQ
jgi:hypothetical protein